MRDLEPRSAQSPFMANVERVATHRPLAWICIGVLGFVATQVFQQVFEHWALALAQQFFAFMFAITAGALIVHKLRMRR